jgi:Domain of unknown function (DUF6458)
VGIGLGLILIAVGAVLTFAVNVTTHGFNVNTIGIILMIVGGLGLLIDLFVFAPRRRSVVVTNDPAVSRTVVDGRDATI